MPGLPCADIFIGWIFERASHIPDRSCYHTIHGTERFFYSPETAGSKCRCFKGGFLSCHYHFFPLCLEPGRVIDSSFEDPANFLITSIPLLLLVKKQYFSMKRLYRLKNDRMLGGVCAGLG